MWDIYVLLRGIYVNIYLKKLDKIIKKSTYCLSQVNGVKTTFTSNILIFMYIFASELHIYYNIQE